MNSANYFGTGCLIGPNIVLTAAHNISEKMEFIPQNYEVEGIPYKVKDFYIPPEYKKNLENKS